MFSEREWIDRKANRIKKIDVNFRNTQKPLGRRQKKETTNVST
jgi:hypothetical protein